MTVENIEKVIVTKSQVSGDGPRFLTDSDTKRVTIAGFLCRVIQKSRIIGDW